MLFKGNSSRLEQLIEKIQANKENHNVSEQDIKGTNIYRNSWNIFSLVSRRLSRKDLIRQSTLYWAIV